MLMLFHIMLFQWGGQRYEDVEKTRVLCRVLDGIECHGERKFLSLKEYPCVKYVYNSYILNKIV